MRRNFVPTVFHLPSLISLRRVLILGCFLALGGAAMLQAASSAAQGASAKGSKAGEVKAQNAQPWGAAGRRFRERARARSAARRLSPEQRQATIMKNAWWNDAELAKRVQLTKTERERLDALLRHYLASRRSAFTKSRTALGDFYTALEAGDLKAASTRLKAVEAARAADLNALLSLRIDVARTLSAEQRKAIQKARPRLWRQRWIRLSQAPPAKVETKGATKKLKSSSN